MKKLRRFTLRGTYNNTRLRVEPIAGNPDPPVLRIDMEAVPYGQSKTVYLQDHLSIRQARDLRDAIDRWLREHQ